MFGSYRSSPNPGGQTYRDILRAEYLEQQEQAVANQVERDAVNAANQKRIDRAVVQSELTPVESAELDAKHGVLGLHHGDNIGVPSSASEAYPLDLAEGHQ